MDGGGRREAGLDRRLHARRRQRIDRECCLADLHHVLVDRIEGRVARRVARAHGSHAGERQVGEHRRGEQQLAKQPRMVVGDPRERLPDRRTPIARKPPPGRRAPHSHPRARASIRVCAPSAGGRRARARAAPACAATSACGTAKQAPAAARVGEEPRAQHAGSRDRHLPAGAPAPGAKCLAAARLGAVRRLAAARLGAARSLAAAWLGAARRLREAVTQGRHARGGCDDARARRSGVLQQDRVERRPVDGHAALVAHALLLAAPAHARLATRVKPAAATRSADAQRLQHRPRRRAQRLADVGAREALALDHHDVMPEDGEARRERRAGGAAADDADSAFTAPPPGRLAAPRGPNPPGRRRSRRPRRSRARRAEVVGPRRAQPRVGAEAPVQPAADVVAGRAAARDHLVVAAAAAQVARPAAAARLLAVDVALGRATAPGARGRRPSTRSPSAPASSPTKRWHAASSPSADTPR